MNKSPMDMMFDSVQWRYVVEPVEDDGLPSVLRTGILKIGPLELVVYQLDNGERIIPEESMNQFLHWLQTGEIQP